MAFRQEFGYSLHLNHFFTLRLTLMKFVYSLLLVLGGLSPILGLAQQLVNQGAPDWARLDQERPRALQSPSTRAVVCGIDTIDYAVFKTNGPAGSQVQLFDISTNGVSRVGQWYDAPDSVNIHGMDFIVATIGPISAQARIYRAGSDSLPMGGPIYSATINLPADTNLSQYSLTFGTPIRVGGPYILALETLSAQAMRVACSGWSEQYGRQEWLAMAGAGNFWLHGYDVTRPNNERFDADALILPHVSYRYDFDFTAEPADCFAFGNEISFNGEISPIFRSRFYNRRYNPLSVAYRPDTTFIWFFSDTDSSFLSNPTHTYAATTPTPDSFTVALLGRVEGYRGSCPVDGEIIKVPWGARADVAATANAGSTPETFDFVLTGQADTWYWNFGDNSPFVFNQATPSHTYATPGVYTVQLVGQSCNTEDTVTLQVEVINTSISQPALLSGLRIGANPAEGSLTVIPQRDLGPITLQLVDAQGRQVWQQQASHLSANRPQSYDLSQLSPGMYWVRVQSAQGQQGLLFQLR
jgi:hypothetical protein